MRKRAFSLLLVILILTVQSPYGLAANKSGKCGANLKWTLGNSGALTISGSGDMTYSSRPWKNFKSDISSVKIDSRVTSIEDWAFADCANLKSVAIPDRVASIGKRAFQNCNSLNSVAIPDGVTGIEERTFYGCDNLKNVSLPDSLVRIGAWAFAYCNSLTKIVAPTGVASIGEGAFSGCDALKKITLSDTVVRIEDKAFENCRNLQSVYYSGSQRQWDAIRIGGDNDPLKNAKLYCNASESDSAISEYSYKFGNSREDFDYRWDYRIPKERFILIYGDTALATQKYAQDWVATRGGWGGNCYGMSSASGILSGESDVSPASFRAGATRPGELDLTDKNPKGLNLTLLEFIEAMHITQYSNTFAIMSKRNENKLSELTAAVSAYENGGGGPVLICLYGPDKNGQESGHAILGYRMTDGRLYVYDCNYPNDGERYISISGEKWSYPINDALTWSSFNGTISYIPYETYLGDWKKRSVLQGPPDSAYVSLTADVANAVIRDGDGKEVAVFKNGAMIRGSDSAYPFLHLGITADGVSMTPPQVSVWLPGSKTYTITNQDASKRTYEAWLANVNQGVSVTTNARSVTLSAADSEQSNYVSIEETDCHYTITQTGQGEVKFTGRTALEKIRSRMEGGSVRSSGLTSSASVEINGKLASVGLFLGGEAVNLAGFDDVLPEQYFYEPVMWALGRGISNGTTGATFEPGKICTRNHILTFLWRANGSPAAEIANPFMDIDASEDFGKAAVWAYEKGLASGALFHGEDPCTRAEAVTYLWKLAGRPSAGRSRFADVPPTAEYAQAVSWAVGRGITNGTTETTFSPSSTCTRGQIVTFLYRAYA